MKVGAITAFADGHTADYIAEISAILEEIGFHSIWVPEHALTFPDQKSKYPYTKDGKIAYTPKGMMDPFIALSYVAAFTKKLRLCTGVSIVPQRNPVYLSKFVADLDRVSNGRFEFGVGVGWQKEEYEALGSTFQNRGKRMDEMLEMMKVMWSPEEISNYDGEYYQLKDAYAFPKPIQTPHPPIFVGGESKAALRRVARLGQGWYGVASDRDTFAKNMDVLDGMLEAENRTRDDVKIYLVKQNGTATKEEVRAYKDLGCEQVVVRVIARTPKSFREKAQRVMDQLN